MTIRDATPQDAISIAAIYSPFVRDTAVSFEEQPPSIDEMRRRIADSHAWLVHETDGEVDGYIYAGRFHPRAAYRWSAEVSVYLGPSGRGKGFGKELLTAMLTRLRALGFVNAFAGTTLPNDASVKLFESFGFERIALWTSVGFKNGEWHDVGWWQLQLREPPVPPAEIGG